MSTHTIALPAALTSAQAAALQQQLCAQLDAAPAQAACVLDAQAVRQFDSAGLALLLACRRHAQAQGRSLRISAWPASLQALAEVYGVWELLA